ncbi:MAG: CoA ester lyase [Chloroflexi bacterium]|nr:CoA ester lyase [Chloroflexota bacterium]
MLLLRTLLFVPGNQARRLEKAHLIPADALILDLEDSVPPSEKDSARKMVAASIDELAASGKDIFVRINSLPTPYAVSDIKAVATKSLRGICLPKSETADDIRRADALLADAEKKSCLEAGSISIMALIETSKGIINAYEIVSASPRIIGAIFGAEDFALEMGIKRTKEGAEIYYPRTVVAVACHAANVLAIDSVYTDVRDTDGLIRETRAVAQLGFQGKAVIHPDQVGPVNQVFVPSDEEIAQARRVVHTFEAAVAQGQASVSLDGKMVDAPVAERARKVLTLADAIAEKGRQGG